MLYFLNCVSHLWVIPQYLIADVVFPFYVKGSDFVLISAVCLWAYACIDLNRPMVTLSEHLHAARGSGCFKGQTVLGGT